jgi:hypothetical protein
MAPLKFMHFTQELSAKTLAILTEIFRHSVITLDVYQNGTPK